MSGDEIGKVFDAGLVLRNEQVTPVKNDCLPSISLTDVKREVDSIEEVFFEKISPVHIFIQPTNGLSYFNISFDFKHLAEELKPYVPFFSYIISRMGAGDLSYDQFALQCETHSNGFSVGPVITSDYKSLTHTYQELFCSSHCLDAKFTTMMSLWEKIFNQVSVHTSASNVDPAKEAILTFSENCPNPGKVVNDGKHDFEMLDGVKHQVTMPYPVNFISRSIRTIPYSDPDAPSLRIMSKLLSSRYLHKHIREIGGAYGSGATDQNGVLSFISYRDPNTSSTLDVFEQSLDWLRSGSYDDSDIAESKISAFSELDAPKSPGEKGLQTFLKRIPITQRQQFRNGLFQVSKEDLLRVGEKYLDFNKSNSVVIGGGSNDDRMSTDNGWREFVL